MPAVESNPSQILSGDSWDAEVSNRLSPAEIEQRSRSLLESFSEPPRLSPLRDVLKVAKAIVSQTAKPASR